MAGLFDIGGKFKPRNVAGVESARFIEPHDCEEIDEWRVKYSNAEKLAKDIGAWARTITSRDRAGLPVNKNDLATAKELLQIADKLIKK